MRVISLDTDNRLASCLDMRSRTETQKESICHVFCKTNTTRKSYRNGKKDDERDHLMKQGKKTQQLQ